MDSSLSDERRIMECRPPPLHEDVIAPNKHFEDCALTVVKEELTVCAEQQGEGEEHTSDRPPTISSSDSGDQQNEDVCTVVGPLYSEEIIISRHIHGRWRCDYMSSTDDPAGKSTEAVRGSQSCISDSVPCRPRSRVCDSVDLKHIHDFHKFEFILQPATADGGEEWSVDGSESAPISITATCGSMDTEPGECQSSEATGDVGGLSNGPLVSSDDGASKVDVPACARADMESPSEPCDLMEPEVDNFDRISIEAMCGSVPSGLNMDYAVSSNSPSKTHRALNNDEKRVLMDELVQACGNQSRESRKEYIEEWAKANEVSADEEEIPEAIGDQQKQSATKCDEKEATTLSGECKRLQADIKASRPCFVTKGCVEETCRLCKERRSRTETNEKDKRESETESIDSESEWITIVSSDEYDESSDETDDDCTDQEDYSVDANADDDMDAVDDDSEDVGQSLSIPNFDLHLARQPVDFRGELVEQLSDFTIIVNKRVFNVHRILLAAISPLFLIKFLRDEWPIDSIVFDDCDPHAMEAVMDYIYSGNITSRQYKKCQVRDLIDQLAMGKDSLKFDEFSAWQYHRFDELSHYLHPELAKLFADLTVTVRDGELTCHKVVLAAQSPYIAALLVSKPGLTHVDLTRYDLHTLRIVLGFLYKEDMQVNCDELSKVLGLFEHLGIYYVTEMADHFYTKHLTYNLSLEYFLLAQQCKLTGLMEVLEELHTPEKTDNQLQTLIEFYLSTEYNPNYLRLLLLSLKWLSISPDKHEHEFLQNLNQIAFQTLSSNEFYSSVELHKPHLHLAVVRALCKHFREHLELLDVHGHCFIVIGGEDATGSLNTDSLKIEEEIIEKAWVSIPSTFHGRSGVIMASDHEIWGIRLIGGKDKAGEVQKDVICCSFSNEWTRKDPVLTERHSGHAVYVWDEIDHGPYLVVAGGRTKDDLPNASIEHCHVDTGKWQVANVPLFKPAPEHMLVTGSSVSRAFFLVKDQCGFPHSLHTYEPAEDIWSLECKFVECENPTQMTCIADKLYVFSLQGVTSYSVTSKQWSAINSAMLPRPLTPRDLVMCSQEKMYFLLQPLKKEMPVLDGVSTEENGPANKELNEADVQHNGDAKPQENGDVQAQEKTTPAHDKDAEAHEKNLHRNEKNAETHEKYAKTHQKNGEQLENGAEAQSNDTETREICTETGEGDADKEENDESVYLYEYHVEPGSAEWISYPVPICCTLPSSFRNAALARVM